MASPTWRACSLDRSPIERLFHILITNECSATLTYCLSLLGGLICPTDQFVRLVRQFDMVFVSMHGTGISEEEKVIATLSATLCEKFPFLPEPIALKYSRFRTFTRMNFLESLLQDQKKEELRKKAEKRAAKTAAAFAASVDAAAASVDAAGVPVAGTSAGATAAAASTGAIQRLVVGETDRRRNRVKGCCVNDVCTEGVLPNYDQRKGGPEEVE